jgi:hypothetical protein
MSETDPRKFFIATDKSGAAWLLVEPSMTDALRRLAFCDFGAADDREVHIKEIPAAEALALYVPDDGGAAMLFGHAVTGDMFCMDKPPTPKEATNGQ